MNHTLPPLGSTRRRIQRPTVAWPTADWPTVSFAAAALGADWPTASFAAAALGADWPTIAVGPGTTSGHFSKARGQRVQKRQPLAQSLGAGTMPPISWSRSPRVA